MSLLATAGIFNTLPVGSEPPGPDDDFEDNSLASWWTAQTAGTSTVVETGGQLVITCPTDIAYDWYSTKNAPRVEQDFTPGASDFQIDVDFSASNSGSGPGAQYQGHGLLILQDTSNWLRFDSYHNGTNLIGFAAKSTAGTPSSQYGNTITSTHWKYLRLTRVSGIWTCSGSPDGASYTAHGSGFAFSLTIAKMAIFAHRSGGAGQYVANVEDIAFS